MQYSSWAGRAAPPRGCFPQGRSGAAILEAVGPPGAVPTWKRMLVPKATATASHIPLDALTRDLPPETRELLSELISLIRSTIPEATERVNLGWKSLNFAHPSVGYFCGLFPSDGRVVVAFEFGVLLPDPDGILDDRGCARQVRYVPVLSPHTFPRAALKRLLRAAISLPPERATRIALVRSGAKPVLPKPRTRKRTIS